MDSLRIVHVDSERGFSGGEVQVFLLIEGLRSRGHQNVLICVPGGRCESEARERGIETCAVPMRSDLDLAALLRLRSAFHSLNASVVHLHTGRATWLGGLAARAAGVPAITTRRMDRPLTRGWRTRLIYGSLVRLAVAISPAVAARLTEGGVSTARVRTISSSVDLSALEPRAGREHTRELLGVKQGTSLLLSLARLHARKGIDVLLRALVQLPTGAWLCVAGDGPERAALEALARKLGVDDRVSFLGTRTDAADLLAACDVCVIPSRLEGLGIAALESMGAGRPVVASRVGGLADAVLDERTGLLVPPDDADALAGALSRLLGDGELRRSLGAAGREHVGRHYRAEQMVTDYEAIYREVSDSIG